MYSFMAVWVHRDTVMLSWRHNVGPFFWRHRLPLQQNNARPHVARNLCTIPGSWSSSTAYILTRHVTHWACLWCPGIGVYKSASCQCPGTLSVALLECIYCLHADDEDEIFLVNYHYRCRQCLYSSSCRMVERHVPSFMSSSLIWLVRNVEAGSVYFLHSLHMYSSFWWWIVFKSLCCFSIFYQPLRRKAFPLPLPSDVLWWHTVYCFNVFDMLFVFVLPTSSFLLLFLCFSVRSRDCFCNIYLVVFSCNAYTICLFPEKN